VKSAAGAATGAAATAPTPPTGFFQVKTTEVLTASTCAANVVGAFGAVPIEIGSEVSEEKLIPLPFTAFTRNKYVFPAVRPEIVAAVELDTVRGI
jgi:hypothetical protein